MEINNLNVILLIIGEAIVTFIPRCIPILYLTSKEIPKQLKDWMKFIPAGVFAALIVPDILTNNQCLNINFSNTKLIAAIIVFIVASRKQSLALSIIVGVSSLFLLSFI